MFYNNLKNLFTPWISNGVPKVYLNNLSLDSRTIKRGDLFIAVCGSKTDGKFFISEAISKGAIAILSASYKDNKSYCITTNNIPRIFLSKLEKNISNISGRFYNHPDQKLSLIAVTGTNGKTSITQILAQWASLLDTKSATMGTLGNGLYNKLKKTKNTTSSAVEIQYILSSFVKQGVKLAAIEVSSHGLIQHRVKALEFSAAIFTNLSQDHLDYHKNMKFYEESKWSLFTKHQVHYCIINLDDKIGKKWLTKLSNKTVAISIDNQFISDYANQWIKANNIIYEKNYVIIDIISTWGRGTIKSFLIGKFNITNLLLSLATLLVLNYPFKDLLSTSHNLIPIPGRMEVFKTKNNKNIVIDYAHTPDALKQSLKEIRRYCKGNIWCIFGCGGDRDKKKRALMGNIAEQYADILILTNDNPRNEDPKKIIQNILKGIKYTDAISVIKDRKKAIFHSVSQANVNDIIFISGKGHEQYQIIKNQCIKYSDQDVIKSL